MVAASHEELVLVAGWGYEHNSYMTPFAKTLRDDQYRGKANVVRSKAEVTKDVTIPQRVHAYTRVTLFDFKTGDRVRWIKGQMGWHEIDRQLQGAVPTHTGKYDDDANLEKRASDDSISTNQSYPYNYNDPQSHLRDPKDLFYRPDHRGSLRPKG